MTPEVVSYLVSHLLSSQAKLQAQMDTTKRIFQLETQLERLVAALAGLEGCDDHVMKGIKDRETELRRLKASQKQQRVFNEEDLTERVRGAVMRLPSLLREDPVRAKTELAS